MMAIKRVLIVDDSPTERHVLNDMLTKAGYEVVASDNGEDAILKAKTVKPDLILMDVVMPGLNGFQATRAISRDRSEEHTSELQSRSDLVCRLLLEKKKPKNKPAGPAVSRQPGSNKPRRRPSRHARRRSRIARGSRRILPPVRNLVWHVREPFGSKP